MPKTYQEEENRRNTELLQNQLQYLPPFAREFFLGITLRTSSKTRLNYAYDLALFFRYLMENHKAFRGLELKDMPVSLLSEVKPEDIDLFLDHMTYYTKEGEALERENHEKGKARKLAAIRSLFKFFYKKGKLPANPATLVETPKIHDKAIVRLEIDELARLLDKVEDGTGLTERQMKYHEQTKDRDLAIITLLAGTGMRVSECVGINLSDLDFNMNAVKVTRKGGNECLLYFGDEVREALLAYIEKRKNMPTQDPKEGALFLSLHNKRINVRSVQNLVQKYGALITTVKKISPHKLRSTFGTNLYRETGDIYLVADVLGHADVNTTKRHYAQIDETRRQQAAKVTKLRRN